MGVTNDVVQIEMDAVYNGQDVKNLYYYIAGSAFDNDDLDDLLADFADNIVVPQKAVQHSLFANQGATARNIFNFAEERLLIINDTGINCTLTAEATPSFLAANFTLKRGNTNVRPGSKRIAGLCETDVAGNVWSPGTTELAAIIAGMEATITTTGGVTFKPVIVGRVPYVTPKGNDAYRLPTSQAEMAANWAYVQGVVYTALTSQRSRKVGKGK